MELSKELPSELIKAIQNHTGVPWWNGEAYAQFRGYHALETAMSWAISDLEDVIEWLREEKQYEKSDRLCTIKTRMEESLVSFRSVGKNNCEGLSERYKKMLQQKKEK